MEFDHGRRRDGYYQDQDQDQAQAQEDSPSNQHLVPSSSTSAEAAMAPATCSNIEKEHMFDKVVTPSDVGKLNRLVIPKQHAERYFPLDPSSNEKGLLLNFEDRSGGKVWRFRYSYWNSSQSYVMTKGWSRFVKEKRLDAGDTVSFSRAVGESSNGHLFIDWKRRPEISEPLRLQPRMPFSMQPSSSNYPMMSFSRSAGTWGSARLLVPNDPNATVYNQHQQINYGYSNAISPTAVSSASASASGSGQYLVFRSAPPVQMQPTQVLDATLGMPMPMVVDSVPVANSQQAAAKRVRLFGVNLEFQESDGQSQNAGTQSSQVLSSPSSSPSPSGKEEQLSLDLDM